ncbi:carbamoyltransferase HypF [uncultured Clostridium sp.]|uniref:carbamoyltransferase HypF n=1 Tax=uncultured Clostridium sp. TaxID=59620 RepID=UPI0025D30C69|nr:carbamoyltransferase HypF [uncultured Clostridium sp.]MDU4324816.1 carbamoyltransferase HypF [Clostridium celatum]
MDKYRKFIEIKGIVQGVGFRPFIYNLAKMNNLSGWVNNTGQGVMIDIEGDKKSLNNFINEIKINPPILSKITLIDIKNKELINYKDFFIKESNSDLRATTYISPDYSVCSECKREIFDKNNRRYRYPFTNCTNCGPRFSIIKNLPYDRDFTTMNDFEMCDSCKAEYNNPENRRFHAQPNACPICGPKAYIVDKNNNEIITDDPLDTAIALLKQGKIFAIKGIGGFNLVCDSSNEDAIKLLREKKYRPTKPFAVMIKNIESVRKYCNIKKEEEELLKSNKRPIVLLEKRDKYSFSENLAPNNKKVGVMLPYTPLHYMLFDDELDSLVMTSANISGEPIIYKDNEAIKKLNNIVDYFLIHNREIYIKIDDSVTNSILGEERVIRLGRGYAPYTLNIDTITEILALGSELKNTISLSNGKDVFISEYIGDLKNSEVIDSLEHTIEHFSKIYNIIPKVLVYDNHPDFEYKKIDLEKVLKLESTIKIVQAQHHHSHIVSCMAENNINEDVIGIAFDGTGYGDDESIWGGEFFLCNRRKYKRVGHLDKFYLPGGEKAIKEPWRIGVSLIYKVFKEKLKDFIPEHLNNKKIDIIKTMIDRKINSPETSSMGRLFDGVSSILGFDNEISFEGEAAINLENICDENNSETYIFQIIRDKESFIFCFDDIIKGIIYDINSKNNISIIGNKFHNTVVKGTIEMALNIREHTNINTVVISGGVFQNEILFKGVVEGLNKYNFNVIAHKIIPCNDSGVSLGQLVIANEVIKEELRGRGYVYSSSSKN